MSVGRILIEMCTYFFSLAFSCPQLSAYCVYMFICACACVRACVSLPLTYVPSFVSEDYSFPFEVRQPARRGRSERRLRAGFHTSPTAACRLGGKYACRPQRHREKSKESEGGVEKEGERKGSSMQGVKG